VELLKTILTGAAGAALVGGIFGIIMWCLNRKAAKEDAAKVDVASVCAARGKTIEDLSKMVSSLIVADRTILYDRIKHLAKAYIKRGWISVEEFEDLKRMHDVYHDELEGNGFLNDLMAAVAKLEKKVL
jgi:hypothetical protein